MNIGEPSLEPPDDEPCFIEYIDSNYDGICPHCKLPADSEETDHQECGDIERDEAALERHLSMME